MKASRSLHRCLHTVFFCFLSATVLFPAVYMIFNSFMLPSEVTQYCASAMQYDGTYAMLHFIPDVFSLESFYQVFLRRPDFLVKFWNSLLMCAGILLFQGIVSTTGGYAFAKFSFPFKQVTFFVLILLMMMPLQATLVPNYIVLSFLNITDSWLSLILPAAFAPLGTFLMTQIYRGIPNETLDAARLDGASTLQILVRILLPIGKSGTISMVLLVFIEAWNMVEQPIVFLKDATQYPLSVFLVSVNTNNFSLSFVCGLLAMLPVLFLFLFFNDELVEGIEFTGIK